MSEPLNFTGTIHTEDLEARKYCQKLDGRLDSIKDSILLIKEKIKEIEKKVDALTNPL